MSSEGRKKIALLTGLTGQVSKGSFADQDVSGRSGCYFYQIGHFVFPECLIIIF